MGDNVSDKNVQDPNSKDPKWDAVIKELKTLTKELKKPAPKGKSAPLAMPVNFAKEIESLTKSIQTLNKAMALLAKVEEEKEARHAKTKKEKVTEKKAEPTKPTPTPKEAEGKAKTAPEKPKQPVKKDKPSVFEKIKPDVARVEKRKEMALPFAIADAFKEAKSKTTSLFQGKPVKKTKKTKTPKVTPEQKKPKAEAPAETATDKILNKPETISVAIDEISPKALRQLEGSKSSKKDNKDLEALLEKLGKAKSPTKKKSGGGISDMLGKFLSKKGKGIASTATKALKSGASRSLGALGRVGAQAARVAGPAAAVAAAGYTGYQVGSYIEKKYDVSGRIAKSSAGEGLSDFISSNKKQEAETQKLQERTNKLKLEKIRAEKAAKEKGEEIYEFAGKKYKVGDSKVAIPELDTTPVKAPAPKPVVAQPKTQPKIKSALGYKAATEIDGGNAEADKLHATAEKMGLIKKGDKTTKLVSVKKPDGVYINGKKVPEELVSVSSAPSTPAPVKPVSRPVEIAKAPEPVKPIAKPIEPPAPSAPPPAPKETPKPVVEKIAPVVAPAIAIQTPAKPSDNFNEKLLAKLDTLATSLAPSVRNESRNEAAAATVNNSAATIYTNADRDIPYVERNKYRQQLIYTRGLL